jgi:uncharacterized ubiquitin-like protein YukD
MKLQVQIINANKAAANSTTLDVAVGPTDTVTNLQEQVASTTKMSAFPDQKLVFKGQTLSSNQSLSDCGVKEGDTLELVVQASEKTLIKQLSDLLGKKAMSPEELGLLYSYKYSISFEDVVNALGSSSCKLRSFLESQKCFSFQGDCVKVVDATEKARQQPPVVLAPIQEDKVHRFIEVSVSVELHTPQGKSHPTFTHDLEEDEDNYMRLQASETVARSMEIIAASEQTPFPDRDLWMGDQRLANDISLEDAGVKNGCALKMKVRASEAAFASQLEELVRERTALATSELDLLYCQRFGTSVRQVLRTLGLRSSLCRFIEGQSQFSVAGGCVTLVNGPKLITPVTKEDEAAALDILDYVIELLCQVSFILPLIYRIERNCKVAREANATIFITQLPASHQTPHLQGLQKAVAETLQAMRKDEPSIDSASIDGDVVNVQVEGSYTICLRLAAA